MKSTHALMCLSVAALACVCLKVGCGVFGGDDISVLAASSANVKAVSAAVKTASQMLQQGKDATSIHNALVSQLDADARVAGAGVDTANGVVWADFIDGETHFFMVIDEATDSAGSLTDFSAASSKLNTGLEPPIGWDPSLVQKQGIGSKSLIGYTHLPGNNKALLANGLSLFHSNWSISDSTDVIERMLKARGYTVKRGINAGKPYLRVEDFKNLSDYSVIVLEAHGARREPKYPAEMLQLPPEVGIPNTGTCGGSGSRMHILTTTPITKENLKGYSKDLFCGRLGTWNVTILQKDKKTTKKVQYYGITPNYVREHAKAKFPKNTLLVINACRGYAGDLSSPFKDMLFDKCDGGAHFLGWTERVDYAKAARALLYLFQFMTISNEEVKVKGIGGKEVPVLKKATPPCGVDPFLYGTLYDIDIKLYATDTATGATLYTSIQKNEAYNLILAPYPSRWIMTSDNEQTVEMNCGDQTGDQPSVTIGGKTVTVAEQTGSAAWRVYASSADYGDIAVSEGGRTSISRPLRRWKPTITVKGKMGGLQYTVTFTLQARATIGSGSFRTSVWDSAPAADFDTYWDPGGSTIGWLVSGQETDISGVVHQYQGSGLRAFGQYDGGGMSSDSFNKEADISVHGLITYTTTEIDGSVTTTYTTNQAVSVTRKGVSLSANWTVAGASFQQNVGIGDNAQVQWSAFSASPAFDESKEPR